MFKTIDGGKLPTRGSKYSACVDLYANEDVTISAGETKVVRLGICIDEKGLKKASDRNLENMFGQTIDSIIGTVDGDEDIVHFDSFKSSHYLQLMIRSSLGSKGLILPNGVGIIDLDYEDEIKIVIHNPVYQITRDLEFLCKSDSESGLDWGYDIKKGNRIGQITLLEHKSYLFDIGTEEKRNGGFGSSGKD